MALKMVREPSETPNINNVDDFIPFRYSYGNQNGYVLGKGQELSHSINGSTFKINSGRVVLQGVESDIDANGFEINIDAVSEKRFYTVYLEINLAVNKSEIKSIYNTIDYPKIEAGDDLTVNSSGTARMELYHFTATNGVISDIIKIVKAIEYTQNIKVENSKNADNADNAIKKPDGSYSGIIEDENGVLKENEQSIIKKETLWEGFVLAKSNESSQSITLLKEIHLNDKIEIEYSFDLSNADRDKNKVLKHSKIIKFSSEDPQLLYQTVHFHETLFLENSMQFEGAYMRLTVNSNNAALVSNGLFTLENNQLNKFGGQIGIYKISRIIE